jgi:uncharacterized membrane protein YedE/YeeE
MSLYAFDAVQDALDSTRAFLLPFDLRRWAKLAFLVFFIGGSGGGGSNPAQFTGNTGGWTPDAGGVPNVPTAVPSIGAPELAIIAAIIVGILAVGLLFGVVAAVFEFVFVKSLSEERVAIREYWGDHWGQGLRLFGFRFVVGLGFLAVTVALLAAAFAPFLFGNARFSVGMLGVAVFGLIVVALVVGLVQGFTTEFVVPIMILEGGGVLAAWRRLWPTLTSQWKEYAAYVIMRLVLQIAVGILVGISLAIVAVILAIPFSVLGFLGYTLLSSQAVVGWALIGLAVALFVAIFVVLSLFAAVPVQTFLRYYALFLLGDTNGTFDLIPERREAVRA